MKPDASFVFCTYRCGDAW